MCPGIFPSAECKTEPKTVFYDDMMPPCFPVFVFVAFSRHDVCFSTPATKLLLAFLTWNKSISCKKES